MSDTITDFLENTGNFRYPPGLDRMRRLLHALGDPQDRLRFVHVAGTNGKGSTCACLDSILRAAGYRTGLYTSPHIFSYCERIRVNGAPIPEDALAALLAQMRPIIDAMPEPPTTFERITAAGFLYFAQQHCDVVVLEVGLGGRFDATNVIRAPEVAVITPIGLDHTSILGSTVAAIAREKAGIIKPGTEVVSAAADAKADAVIRNVCLDVGCPLYEAEPQRLTALRYSLTGTELTVAPYGALHLPLLGVYQPRNALTALTVLERLHARGWQIEPRHIAAGLSGVVWEGRFERLRAAPDFLLDGAHNPHGIAAATQSLQTYYPGRKIVFLLGVLADKDVGEMLSPLLPLAERFVLTAPPSARALSARALGEQLTARGSQWEACASVERAVARALTLAGRDGVVCALGSLYFSGDVRRAVAAQEVCCDVSE